MSFHGSFAPPPSYEEVMQSVQANQTAVTLPEGTSEGACDEMFSSGSTYARMLVLAGILAGIGFLIFGGIFQEQWALITGGVLFGVFYLTYVVDVFCCGSNFKFLSHPSQNAEIHNHVDEVRAAPPVIVWVMECYHYETRTRTVYSGSGANRTSRTETYTVKVTTWTGHQAFEYTNWADVSAPEQLQRLQLSEHTRVRFVKSYELADEATALAFTQQRDWFVMSNRHRDTHYDLKEEFVVQGFVPAMLASQTEERPFFLRLRWYLLAVLFLLELPFSFMIKRESALMEYVYVKRVTFTPPLQPPVISGGQAPFQTPDAGWQVPSTAPFLPPGDSGWLPSNDSPDQPSNSTGWHPPTAPRLDGSEPPDYYTATKGQLPNAGRQL